MSLQESDTSLEWWTQALRGSLAAVLLTIAAAALPTEGAQAAEIGDQHRGVPVSLRTSSLRTSLEGAGDEDLYVFRAVQGTRLTVKVAIDKELRKPAESAPEVKLEVIDPAGVSRLDTQIAGKGKAQRLTLETSGSWKLRLTTTDSRTIPYRLTVKGKVGRESGIEKAPKKVVPGVVRVPRSGLWTTIEPGESRRIDFTALDGCDVSARLRFFGETAPDVVLGSGESVLAWDQEVAKGRTITCRAALAEGGPYSVWIQLPADAPSTGHYRLAMKLHIPKNVRRSVSARSTKRELGPEPRIVEIYPPHGPESGGSPLELRGANFLAAGSALKVQGADQPVEVLVGGVPATGVRVSDPSTIRFDSPVGTGAAATLQVFNADGQNAVLPGAFEFVPAPVLDSVAPAHGPVEGGGRLTLTGSNFRDDLLGLLDVRIGGAPATHLSFVNASTITCDSPAGSGTSTDVVLVNDDGQSVTLGGVFEFVPAPELESITLTHGPELGGQTLTLSGNYFRDDLSGLLEVSIGETPAGSVSIVNATTITCASPPGAGAGHDVVVVNDDGQSVTLSSAFEFVAAPQLDSITPSQGDEAGGQTITLSGEHFRDDLLGSLAVRIGGASATSVVMVNETSITCVSPAGTGPDRDVVLVNDDGQSVTRTGAFDYVSAPSGPNISYPQSSYVFTQSQSVGTITPTNTGGAVTTWSVSPALPAGLALSSSTGAITGTPTATASQATHTVTASGSSGTDTFDLSIRVDAASTGATYYVDPTNGHDGNDGSTTRPWRTLQDVIDNKVESRSYATIPYQTGKDSLIAKNAGATVQPGDTIVLRTGYHGHLRLVGYVNSSVITVKAQANHTPSIGTLDMNAVANWTFQGITISPGAAPSFSKSDVVEVGYKTYSGPSSDITLDSCKIQTVADISNWSATDWVNKAGHGVVAFGKNMILRDNAIKNVVFGAFIGRGTGIVLDGNVIENFSGDGIRVDSNAHGLLIENNTIKNNFAVDGNHDDGIQFWMPQGASKDVVIRGNRVYQKLNHPKPSLNGELQGIASFDVEADGWLVENNLVVVVQWHGISVYGAKNCVIVNNTCHDTSGTRTAWIHLGRTSRDNIIRNNLSQRIFDADGTNNTFDHNYEFTVSELNSIFVDHAKSNLKLKKNSAAIDIGSSTNAPKKDIDGVSRPQGSAVDVGCYEYK